MVWPLQLYVKSIHRPEKHLEANLSCASSCSCPAYRGSLALRRPHDLALPLLGDFERDNGEVAVTIAATDGAPIVNGNAPYFIIALTAVHSYTCLATALTSLVLFAIGNSDAQTTVASRHTPYHPRNAGSSQAAISA